MAVIGGIINLVWDINSNSGFFGLGLPSPMTQYTLIKQGLALEFPDSWGIHLTPQGNHGDEAVIALILVPDHSFPNIIIAENSPYSNILSVAQWGEIRSQARAQSLSLIKTISLSTYNAQFFPAMLYEYIFEAKTLFGTIDIHCLDYYILYSGTGYAFSFCAYQKNWSEVLGTFNKMIQSIRPNQ
jgi:hypothetical protein